MEQKLFTELRPLYTTSKERPNEIRIRIRMRDMIAPDVLRQNKKQGGRAGQRSLIGRDILRTFELGWDENVVIFEEVYGEGEKVRRNDSF